MHASSCFPRPSAASWRRLSLGSALAALLIAPAGLSGRETVRTIDAVAAPERDHHLFVGIDLYLSKSDGLAKVRRIEPGATVVESAEGGLERETRVAGFNWRREMKVAPRMAKIDGFKARPVYSPANDPYRKQVGQQAALMAYLANEADEADHMVRTMDTRIKWAEEARMQGGQAPSAEQITSETFTSFNQAHQQMDTYVRHVSLDQTGTKEGAENFDGLLMEFEVTVPEAIPDAYLVVLTRLRDPKGEFLDVNYSHFLGAMAAGTRKVDFAQFGLPPGFEHLESKVYLFSRGEEVPSNLSERHLALTGPEARQFVLESHLAAHRGKDAPAEVVWGLAPPLLRGATDRASFDFPVEVEVDETGALIGIREDGTRVLPTEVRQAVEGFTYLPELRAGRPVASVLTVNPAAYFE